MNGTGTLISDPAGWVDAHGDALYRFALMRVRDPATAEDLVQDTLLAALRARDSYTGAAAERTWLIAILKNKITDHFRRSTRETALPDVENPDEVIDALFRESNDHWVQPPSAWGDPDRALEQAGFWKVFEDCFASLPARQAQAFALTEFDGQSGDELCKNLSISSSNLWVLLHRARMRLRECLEQHWFEAEKGNR
jgi:RNA polymerase sigma-70 factor (ECF subfamily)